MNKIQIIIVSFFLLLSFNGCGIYQYSKLGGEMYAAQNDYIECVKQNPDDFEVKCKALKEIYKVKKEKFESHPVHNMDRQKVRVDVNDKEKN